MKLGEVLKKERQRRNLDIDGVAGRLGITVQEYEQMEAGSSPVEDWGPRLANIAIALRTPTSRLISETGKSPQAKKIEGQCGKLIVGKRQSKGMSCAELASKIGIDPAQLQAIEAGLSELETYAPILLSFSEVIDQPIFNLFYPCGLPLQSLQDYP